MPLRFFTTRRADTSRLANDVGGVQMVITDTMSNILSNVVMVISTLVAMFLLSWQLTVCRCPMLPLFLWLTVKVGRARQEVATSTAKTLAGPHRRDGGDAVGLGVRRSLPKTFERQRFRKDRFQTENQRLTGLPGRRR